MRHFSLQRPYDLLIISGVVLLLCGSFIGMLSGDDFGSSLTGTAGDNYTPTPESNDSQSSSIAIAIRNESGSLLGTGEITVSHPTQLLIGSSDTIRLALHIENAESNDAVMPNAEPSIIAEGNELVATFESAVEVYQLMGASLHCPADFFTGCTEHVDNPEDARIVADSGRTWTWQLSPTVSQTGQHELRLSLWTLISIDDEPSQTNEVWDYVFPISITEKTTGAENTASPLALAISGIGFLMALTGGILRYWDQSIIQRRQKVPSTRTTSDLKPLRPPTPAETTTLKTDIRALQDGAPFKRTFISYRRNDSIAHARLIYSLLVTDVGHENVVMDVESFRLGEDFVARINDEMQRCDVVLVIIADDWSGTATRDDGTEKRRIDDPADFVRLEIELALRHGLEIIPVVINNAKVPRSDELPTSIRPLANRNGIALRMDYIKDDIRRLISHLVVAVD